MSKQTLTGAQILWDCLVRQGVNVVFGYPGGAILPAYDAMLGYPIRHILTRHEQGATHMADGYARATGKVGVGFVRGFKLKNGALASSVAHDAHNVVVVGTNDADIVCAIQRLEKLQGGLVAVAGGDVKAELGLPIAGLVSDKPLNEVIKHMADLNAAAEGILLQSRAP